MTGRDAEHRDGTRNAGADARGSERDDVLARKRARVALIERLDRHGHLRAAHDRAGEVSAIRLLAEVDLALSEHRGADGC
jgi:hypothetical protein